jgi:hypothetical protein
VTYTVAKNTGGQARTGTLTIAGQTVTVSETVGNAPLAPGHVRIVP